MTEHTPTPWHVMTHYGEERLTSDLSGQTYCVILDEGGSWPEDIICEVWGENQPDEANAAFIVRAVNCHDDLVKALENASEALVYQRRKGSLAIAGFVRDTRARVDVVEMLDRLDAAIVDVRAILAKARGETP